MNEIGWAFAYGLIIGLATGLGIDYMDRIIRKKEE